MKNHKYSKKEIEKYNWTIKYINEELKEDRHIIACLGSAGLTFNNDIERFVHYASHIDTELTHKILEHCDFIKI